MKLSGRIWCGQLWGILLLNMIKTDLRRAVTNLFREYFGSPAISTWCYFRDIIHRGINGRCSGYWDPDPSSSSDRPPGYSWIDHNYCAILMGEINFWCGTRFQKSRKKCGWWCSIARGHAFALQFLGFFVWYQFIHWIWQENDLSKDFDILIICHIFCIIYQFTIYCQVSGCCKNKTHY